ncbi:MAG: type IV secretory system conjugative DNA transfer family protein [Candidatus Baltobacteraceae bacterium]
MSAAATGSAAIPPRVGASRSMLAAYAVAGVVVVLGSAVATQLVAHDLRDNPSLGMPFARLPVLGALYAPWAWAAWWWHFGNPFAGVEYPANVRAAIATLPWSIGITFALAYVSLLVVAIRSPRVDVSRMVDSAHWASDEELREKGLLGGKSGPIIGGLRDAFGRIVPLRYGGRLGISFTGPPDAGKTSSFAATDLLISLQHEDAGEWTADQRRKDFFGEEVSFVVVDPKGHLRRATSGYQHDVLGKDVLVLEPLSTDEGLAAYNPLWSIRLGTDFEQYDCYRLGVDLVLVEGGQAKDYWEQSGPPFGSAMIGKLAYRSLYENDATILSLPGLLDYVSSFGKIEDLVKDMTTTEDDPHGIFGWQDAEGKPTRVCPWIAAEARILGAKAADESSGVFGTFSAQLGIYRNQVMRRHICRSTFTFADLANRPKPAVLYICVPGLEMDTLSPWLRLLVKTALRELTQTTESIGGQEVRGNLRSTIMLLDDFAALGRLRQVAASAGYLRGHGVALWLIWQGTSQLESLYGHEETLSETIGVHITAAPRTHGPAKDLSEALGQTSAIVRKANESGERFAATPLGHIAEQNDVVTRALLTASEVQSLGNDETLVVVDGLKVRATKFSFFKNDELRQRSEMPPVQKSDVIRVRPPYHEALEGVLGLERFERLFAQAGPKPKPEPKPKPAPPTDSRILAALAAGGFTLKEKTSRETS